MSRRTLQAMSVGGVLAIGSLLGFCEAKAHKHSCHRATRCNLLCLPAYPYSQHAGCASASVVAIASADQPTTITNYLPSAEPGETRRAVSVLRRVFPVTTNSVTVDGVTLERMGLAFYSTGQYACTGLLRFDGGPDGSLLGANVVVRVRAYSGVPQHPGGLTGMRLLWESERPIWVSRGQSVATSLLPDPPQQRKQAFASPVGVHLEDMCPCAPSDIIYQHFDEITHLEVVLERYRDR
jgi:hypothetical protein